jgi:hypothetical protein
LYLCGACHHPVDWSDKGVLCELCDTWFHINCQKIDSRDYSKLNHSSVVWECCNCKFPNITQSLFSICFVQVQPIASSL